MFYCCFLSGKISEKSVEISPRFAIILAYFYTHVQGLRIRAGRPVYEMRTSHILTERGLIAMRNRTTLLRAEQSRAWANCVLFASCDCEAHETEYNIRDG